MKKSNVIVFVIFELAYRFYEAWRSRSIFKRAADGLLAFSGMLLVPSIWEYLIDSAINASGKVQASVDQGLKAGETAGFIALFVAVLFYIAAHFSERKKSSIEKLVFDKRVEEICSVNKSKVIAYLGSVTQISDIEVMVTSEDTDLNLGSLSGTSVSGRTRKMAATYDMQTRELVRDDLAMALAEWKAQKKKYSNFPLGTCVPLHSLSNLKTLGIQCVLLAVAIQKNDSRISLIDRDSICRIVQVAIDQCVDNGYASVFVPVFGLGSGNVPRSESIDATCSAIRLALEKSPHSIQVYVDIYRVRDFISVNKAFV